MKHPFPKKEKEFAERVIRVNRITRVVKGGRRLRFRATVAIGDHKGRIGLGVAKANEVADAVAKAVAQAKKNLINVPIVNDTIPHQIIGKFNAASILMKPAAQGTGVIAGGAVRDILEISGIKNIVSKTIGTTNKINCAKATLVGLSQLRSKEDIAAARGIKLGKSTGNQPIKEELAPKEVKTEAKEKKTDKKTAKPKPKTGKKKAEKKTKPIDKKKR